MVDRLAKEADLFDKSAHRVVGVETLRQTLPKNSRISRSKRGIESTLPEKTLTVISEYGFVALDERGGWLKEARMITSVDGLRWKKGNKGLESLAGTLSTADDKKKRSLLESFEDYGLQGFVTDLGQLIVLFARGLVSNYEFTYDSIDASDPLEPLQVYRYSQLGGTDALTVYEDKQPLRLKIQGKLWVRKRDSLPVRISIESTREGKRALVHDVSVVEYQPTEWGFVLPKRINHKQFVDNQLFVEDDFSYDRYQQILSGAAR